MSKRRASKATETTISIKKARLNDEEKRDYFDMTAGALPNDLIRFILYLAVRDEPLNYYSLLCVSKRIREQLLTKGCTKPPSCSVEPFLRRVDNPSTDYNDLERYRAFLYKAMIRAYDPDDERKIRITKEQDGKHYRHNRIDHSCDTPFNRVHSSAAYLRRLNDPSLDYAEWILLEKKCLKDDDELHSMHDNVEPDKEEREKWEKLAHYDLYEYACLYAADHKGEPDYERSDKKEETEKRSTFHLLRHLDRFHEREWYGYPTSVDLTPFTLSSRTFPTREEFGEAQTRKCERRGCADTGSVERLLNLAINSGVASGDEKWKQIKIVIPYVYSLGKEWPSCLMECRKNRHCPNVYVRSFVEEDVSYLYSLLASYLPTESFVKDYRYYRRISTGVFSSCSSLAPEPPTADYDLCEYIMEILRIVDERTKTKGSISDARGKRTERITKTRFNLMTGEWWKKTLKRHLGCGTPESISWIYENINKLALEGAIENIEGYKGYTPDRRLMKYYHRCGGNMHENRLKKMRKLVMNNPYVPGAFEAFLTGEALENRYETCHPGTSGRVWGMYESKKRHNLKVAAEYTRWLIDYGRLESCHFIFNLYLKPYCCGAEFTYDDKEEDYYGVDNDGEDSLYKMYKRNATICYKDSNRLFTWHGLEKFTAPEENEK
jgi:hypothetical protein